MNFLMIFWLSLVLVSFSGNGNIVATTRHEPISLATLERDCFIIPVHSLERFLPAGIPVSSPFRPSLHQINCCVLCVQLPPPCDSVDVKNQGPLSVLEVSDPKICILAHLMSPLEPIDPIVETPLNHPLLKQRSVAAELLMEVQQANTAIGGMLLANMERNGLFVEFNLKSDPVVTKHFLTAEFPFIAYYIINTQQTDPSSFYSGVRGSSLSKFDPKKLRFGQTTPSCWIILWKVRFFSKFQIHSGAYIGCVFRSRSNLSTTACSQPKWSRKF